MTLPTHHCPVCHHRHTIVIDAVVLVVCDSCHHLLKHQSGNLIDLGQTTVASGRETLLQIGDTGRLRNRPFEVISQISFCTTDEPDILWHEWAIIFEDKTFGFIYVYEDEILYTTNSSQHITPSSIPRYDDIEIGDNLEINRHQFVVEEKGEAVVVALAGQHVEVEIPGEQYKYLDLTLRPPYIASLEYKPEGCLLYFGTAIERENLIINRLL